MSLGGRSATYDWSQVVTGLPGSVSYSGSGIFGTRTPDPFGRLGSISWKGSAAGPIVSSHSYTHNDWGSRATAEKEDGGTWHYGYNARQEVTSAVKKDAADIALPGRSTEYAYDEIGNRLSHQERLLDGTWAETSYQTNSLNQYETITHPNPFTRLIEGAAHGDSNVEIDLLTATGETSLTVTAAGLATSPAQAFAAEAALDVSSGPIYQRVRVRAARSAPPPNSPPGAAPQNFSTEVEGYLWFPPQTETLTYDEDGNLTGDARWIYRWNAENRLIEMESTPAAIAAGVPATKLTFLYDSQGRRTEKKVFRADPANTTTWILQRRTRFLYDN